MEKTTDTQSCLWREEDGIVYFSVQSTGTTENAWRNKFQPRNGYSMRDGSAEALGSSDFKVTRNVTYNIALLRSRHVGNPEYLTTQHIFTEGERKGLQRMTPEAVFLMRELLSDNDILKMRFNWVVGMHTPLTIQCSQALLSIPAQYDVANSNHKRRMSSVFLSFVNWRRASGGWAFLVPS